MSFKIATRSRFPAQDAARIDGGLPKALPKGLKRTHSADRRRIDALKRDIANWGAGPANRSRRRET
jgi:hypothetical protein